MLAVDNHPFAPPRGVGQLAATTALIVAHRPSTVMLADRVALLEGGRITAVGRHSELLASSDHYRFVISSLEDEEKREEQDREEPKRDDDQRDEENELKGASV